MKKITSLIIFCFIIFTATAQRDTVYLSADNIQTNVLKPSINQYLVYFKNGKDSSRTGYQFWTRIMDTINYNGKKAISIKQVWENNDTIFHTTFSVCDAKTFLPLYQDAWWKSFGNLKFDFIKREAEVLNHPLTENDTAAYRKRMWSAFEKATTREEYNWHLDLEIFSTLPFRDGNTYGINFYDPGQSEPQIQYYTISGSGLLKEFNDRQTECWLLTHGKEGNRETFWISKKTKEILKLEQEANGKFRYKIKLPFAS